MQQDWWTWEVLVIVSGLLPRPEMVMSMMGITFNASGEFRVALRVACARACKCAAFSWQD